ncbi:maltose operon protein MalM [Xenorhabdus sp. Flor]|uniref:maltose operon protein MalM n=1 Tax=Xenorhabdus cabanillasii TaxID=351673 RepID=UPI0019847E98|nr:maltose operon protein MalM [Xenorhabdus sp. Flor]MBD2816080.1 maltose operon protein MalM [Xenorhabdus sp. Flor]
MRIKLLPICFGILFCMNIPTMTYAVTETVSDKTLTDLRKRNSVAPSLPISVLQKLAWQPVNTNAKQTVTLSHASLQLNQGNIQGAVAALALPANHGALKITLNSLIKDRQVYSPNVLVLDEQFRPAAFYPSHYFTYQQPSIMSADRLEGTLKLTPALGQQQIYMLIYTTHADLQTSTEMVDPAKAYAQGVGNAVPNIPNPIARHTDTGTLTLKVKSERDTGNILIGHSFTVSEPKTVTVGSTHLNTVPSQPSSITPETKPVLGDTEQYFNEAIKKAVRSGDIDKALKLLDEAERLGSPSARETFIKMVKNKE